MICIGRCRQPRSALHRALLASELLFGVTQKIYPCAGDAIPSAEVDHCAAVSLQHVIDCVGVEEHVGDARIERGDVVASEHIRHRRLRGVEEPCAKQHRIFGVSAKPIVPYIAVPDLSPQTNPGQSIGYRDSVLLDDCVLHLVIGHLVSEGEDSLRPRTFDSHLVIADDDRGVLNSIPRAEQMDRVAMKIAALCRRGQAQ